MKPPIPRTTAQRLSLYLRRLRDLQAQGARTVSSRALAEHLGFTSELVRRDLGYFGTFGRRGVGYSIAGLAASLREILGTAQRHDVALVGYGNLGRALSAYAGFARRNFDLSAVFDADPKKVGHRAGGVRVRAVRDMVPYLKRHRIRIAILAVPAQSAQRAAERLVRGGVVGILNFSPTALDLPRHVVVNHVDLATGLEEISFRLKRSCGAS